MSQKQNRRDLFRNSLLAGAGFWVASNTSRTAKAAPKRSANEKLNLACIGVGGRGEGNVQGVEHENIVAMCDVDKVRARDSFAAYPTTPKFKDYRLLLDKHHKDIDAVVIATPDHMHAPITLAAMQLGKHVYCEKPLTHTIYEAALITAAAGKYKVVTQMGNGGMAEDGARRSYEILKSGAIGTVREVHAWTDRPNNWWPQALNRPTETPAVPNTLDWDLWLGVAPERPYNPIYLPANWRGWWDFGTGAMGDMACHICNVAFWALELRDPTSVEAESSPRFAETMPSWSVITYQFPERNGRAPVTFKWYDGGKKPSAKLVEADSLPDNGSIFIGDKGTMYLPCPNGTGATLHPKEKYADFKDPPQTLPRVSGHHQEWLDAIRTNTFARSDFHTHAGPMTEAMLVGNLAVRTGQRIEWDAKNLRATNCEEANLYVNPPYRRGWQV